TAAEGTACVDPSSSECDNPDSCDATGSCQANHAPEGTPCGAGGTCLGGECRAPSATGVVTSWVASPMLEACTGPSDGSGNPWTAPNFDEVGSGWVPVTLPDVPRLNGMADRYYRGHFGLASPVADLSVFFRCDDGCELWVNEIFIGPFGSGACHEPGCVNLPGCGINSCVPPVPIPEADLLAEGNIVAVHLTNGTGGSQLQASVFRGSPGTCGNCAVDTGETCDPTALGGTGTCSNDECGLPGTTSACDCHVTQSG